MAPFTQLRKHTNKNQPDKFDPKYSNHGQTNPEERWCVHRHPEEATIRGVDDLRRRIRALKHPMRVPALWINLIPPPKPYQAAAGNVFQVVEVDSKEEDGDNEDEDAATGN